MLDLHSHQFVNTDENPNQPAPSFRICATCGEAATANESKDEALQPVAIEVLTTALQAA